jgi:hypothetical protein
MVLGQQNGVGQADVAGSGDGNVQDESQSMVARTATGSKMVGTDSRMAPPRGPPGKPGCGF